MSVETKEGSGGRKDGGRDKVEYLTNGEPTDEAVGTVGNVTSILRLSRSSPRNGRRRDRTS